MDIAAFVEAQLPPTPARVLEIGCGAGDLACAVARLGYRIVAIDPKAPDGDIFESVSLEEFAGRGPFDAAVANRALHHIPDLAGALDKVARLLGPRGRLIVHEHAWERMDEPTARWYLERRERIDPAAPRSVESCLADWNTDHAGLHGSVELRAALDQRFKERLFAWTPYLYAELGGTQIELEECDLVEAGRIRALGFIYAGENRARS
jgi:SAM-dependent methyltransferase